MKPVYHTVYEIWNPFTLECIYVGKGNTTRTRFPDHIRDARNFEAGKSVTNVFKAAVILKILKMGSEPVFFEIGRFETEDESLEEEKRLIEYYGRRIDGGTLTNFSLGGQGNYGIVMPEEHSRKKSERQRGKKESDATREKKRLKALGRKHTEETKRKISENNASRINGAWNKGKEWSDGVKKKIKETKTGSKWSDKHRETIQNMDEEKLKEWRMKIGVSRKGKPWTEARRKAHENATIKNVEKL